MPVASRQQVLLEILFTLEKAANWCHSVGGSLSLENRGLDKQEGGGREGSQISPRQPTAFRAAVPTEGGESLPQ